MAAYAAVISLKQTIERLLNSSRISIAFSSRGILEYAYEQMQSSKQVLKILDDSDCRNSKEIKGLEAQMRDGVLKLEDVIEFHFSNQFFSQSESLSGNEGHLLLFPTDLDQEIHSFIVTFKKMEEMLYEELHKPLTEEEKGVDDIPSIADDDGKESEMIGSSYIFQKLRDELLEGRLNKTFSIVGMAGIGKTVLAMKTFEDPLIKGSFDCRAFVRVGQNYRQHEKLRSVLAQVNHDSDKILVEGDEKIDEHLRESLTGKRYLIVLDDLWDSQLWTHMQIKFPDEYNGSVILVTTRLGRLSESISPYRTYKIGFLNKDESWDLLREKVFGEELCPVELEKAGKKIAENCEGLPLLILTVADMLSEAEMTQEYWNKIAADKENSIFMAAYDEISMVLYPSYNYLPQDLKACFMYMGAFPQKYGFRLSKLIYLWNAEGFLEPNLSQRFEDYVEECLRKLVSNNVVMIRQRTSSGLRVKDYGLHSVFWRLCKREAAHNKFLCIVNSFADGLAEGVESHRHLSIHKNILFSIKDVYHSVESVSSARSLLCLGAHHQYQVPMCSGLRLLRVLDALTIRFYEFPVEVVKLVELRYLAVTCNENLPSSTLKLGNLQHLIVHQYLNIKSTVDESYLPLEIWSLQELKYLHIMGRNLPNPPHGVVLPNLLTLLDVGIHSCTKGVLESIPMLDNLRVRIELPPDVVEPLSYFSRDSFRSKLRSLQCTIVNPTLRSKIILPLPLSFFTPYLQKLTLNGLGHPWEDMDKIAKLPYLKVLKLQSYAFRGEKWEVKEGFFNLIYLLIDDTDLVRWKVGKETFQYLQILTLRNCYKLQEIPETSLLRKIELVYCHPSAAARAKKMEAAYRQVYINSSWDDADESLMA